VDTLIPTNNNNRVRGAFVRALNVERGVTPLIQTRTSVVTSTPISRRFSGFPARKGELVPSTAAILEILSESRTENVRVSPIVSRVVNYTDNRARSCIGSKSERLFANIPRESGIDEEQTSISPARAPRRSFRARTRAPTRLKALNIAGVSIITGIEHATRTLLTET
jgi:hypothetical protein